jgi:phage terminase large subunit
VDLIGVGAGVYDRLQELVREQTLGIPVYGVNVAERAPERRDTDEDAQPKTLRDHLWLLVWKWLRLDTPVFAADREACEDLAGELSNVRYSTDSNGRIVIESKDQMKGRHLRSPDLADALGLTFAPATSMVAIDIDPTEMEAIWAEARRNGTLPPAPRQRRAVWSRRVW